MSKMSLITFIIFSFFQEEVLSRRSVAELAGRFKGTAPQQDATGQESVRLMFKICIILEPILPSTGRTLLQQNKRIQKKEKSNKETQKYCFMQM